jgi:uncharacterized protein
MRTTHAVEVSDGVSVTAVQTVSETPASDIVVLYAPGAGSNINDRFGVFLGEFLEAHGVESWRFQFPYSEKGRRAPDRPPVLAATWRAVIEAASQHPRSDLEERKATVAMPRPSGRGTPFRRIVASGRSMGGRIASMVAAEGAPVAALALFAYPLIPPGRTTSDRADHFPAIAQPVLLCSGTRDSFATPAQLRDAASRLPDAALHFLEGADHGFNVLKSSGRTREDVWQEACEALLAFLEGLPQAAA